MNRLIPCPECGCPVLFHRAPRDPVTGAGRMACSECRNEDGTERLCAAGTDA